MLVREQAPLALALAWVQEQEQVQALARGRALVAWAPESVQVQVWGLALAGVPGQERAQVSGPAQAPPRELE